MCEVTCMDQKQSTFFGLTVNYAISAVQPIHRCTYMSVKLSIIALFLEMDLDCVIALRTAPSNSWANPVERIMSIVNMGLQGVGVMRRKGNEVFEKSIGESTVFNVKY